MVLNEIEANPYITREKLENKYGRSSRTFQRVLDSLKEKKSLNEKVQIKLVTGKLLKDKKHH